jgi:hypothetical protein
LVSTLFIDGGAFGADFFAGLRATFLGDFLAFAMGER